MLNAIASMNVDFSAGRDGAADNLLRLGRSGLLLTLWPAERVVMGRRACKLLHQELSNHVDSILLVESCQPSAVRTQKITLQNRMRSLPQNEGTCVQPQHILQTLCQFKGQAISLRWKRFRTFDTFVKGFSLAASQKMGGMLVHLDLSEAFLQDATKLRNVLMHCSTLQSLTLVQCNIDSQGLQEISEGLKNCTQLSVLDLRCNQCSRTASLAEALTHLPHLRELKLSNNALGDYGLQDLETSLPRCSALVALELAQNWFSVMGATSLSRAMSEHVAASGRSSVRCVDLQSNNLSGAGFRRLVTWFENCELSTLCLRECSLTAQDLEQLCARWTSGRCVGIAHLDLSANWFAVKGIDVLGRGLIQCAQLKTLNLSENRLLDSGAARLSEVLGKLTELRELKIRLNSIGSIGLSSLVQGMAPCTALERLEASSNRIRDDGLQSLVRALDTGCWPRLQSVDLHRNSIGAIGVAAVGQTSLIQLGQPNLVVQSY